jgi:hypothetical protein
LVAVIPVYSSTDRSTQDISLAIDTGSSNVWVPSAKAADCPAHGCPAGGAFNPDDSSTLSYFSNGTFQASYGTGSASGDYIEDEIHIGSLLLQNLTMGLATKSSSGSFENGLFGLGYESLQTLAVTNGIEFPGVLTQMKRSGIIDRRLFSVYLNDQKSGVGNIIFGGIDTSKYTGDLVSLAITPNGTGIYDRYRVDLTSVSYVDNTGKATLLSATNMSAPTTLDTGSNLNILPVPVIKALVQGTGAVYFGGFYWADCKLRDGNESVAFQFGGIGGPIIHMGVAQMLGTPSGVTFSDGSDACELFVSEVSEVESYFVNLGGYTLGQPFIRSAYVVYDQDNNEISIAQAILDQYSSAGFEGIAAGADLPNVTSTNTETATAAPTNLPKPTSSRTGSRSSSSTPTTSQGSQSAQPNVTGTTKIPVVPSSPSFNFATAMSTSESGTAVASYTSTSGVSHDHSLGGLDLAIAVVVAFVSLVASPW